MTDLPDVAASGESAPMVPEEAVPRRLESRSVAVDRIVQGGFLGLLGAAATHLFRFGKTRPALILAATTGLGRSSGFSPSGPS